MYSKLVKTEIGLILKLVKTEIGLILKLCELIYGVGTTRHYITIM